MRAHVVTGPSRGEVREVPDPEAGGGEVVVHVDRVGVCGTDVELFTGEMAYFEQGHTHFPVRLGHEWCGRVVATGDGVDRAWLGQAVAGDPMLGDGTCRRCLRGAQHVCDNRGEMGLRDGVPGALAERVAVPVTALHVLPPSLDPALGAMVEPGGNAFRAAVAAAVKKGERVLVMGPGTIGLLTAMFLRADGAEVHLMGETDASIAFARELGFETVWREANAADGKPYDAVVDCSNAKHLPALGLDLVEPAGRIVYIGLAGAPSRMDTRVLALKDVTAVGVLSASPALAATIDAYARGVIDPRPLIAATVPLDAVTDVLAGARPAAAGPGPKIHVNPNV